MRTILRALCAGLLCCAAACPGTGRADPRPVHLAFDGYAAGFPVLALQTDIALAPARYRVDLSFHTTGLAGAVLDSSTHTVVEGAWAGDRPQPTHYESRGTFRGDPRATVMDYAGDTPLVRQLLPLQDRARQPVPPDMERQTVDSLSAMAMLVRHVADTGTCEGGIGLFDGRRVSRIAAVTVGMVVLKPNGRSAFSGPALRCDFVGQQLAGFPLDADPAEVRRPIRGTAWLAQVVPGAPAMPVRLKFETRFVGPMRMYLTAAAPLPG